MKRQLAIGSLVGFLGLTMAGTALAGQYQTSTGAVAPSSSAKVLAWNQVVDRGMPDFTDPAVSQGAFMVTSPVNLSFPFGVRVVFLFVNHEGQLYGVYHDRNTGDVVGILRADWDPSAPQGLRFYDFYVDTGLLTGHGLSGEFLYVKGNGRIFTAVCGIAVLSKEARVHSKCPRRA